jgi:Aerobic-type carbon monoxide dehydrogenase, middle subunit CoxM/CutM homologs
MVHYELKDYIKPKTSEEALKLLHDYKGAAKIIAGGTVIHELSERNLLEGVEYFVDIENLGLNYVRIEKDGLHIGATTTFNQIVNNSLFTKPSYYALYLAAKGVSSYQVRNVATIGGSVCSSISFLDVPNALVALNAKAKLVSLNGERIENVENLFLGMLNPNISEDEILTEIILPLEETKTASYYMKLTERAFDYAIVSVGIKVKLNENGYVENIRTVFGNVQPTPYIENKVYEIAKGKYINEDLIKKIMEEIPSVEPIDSINASAWYKKKVLKVLFRDALKETLEMIS